MFLLIKVTLINPKRAEAAPTGFTGFALFTWYNDVIGDQKNYLSCNSAGNLAVNLVANTGDFTSAWDTPTCTNTNPNYCITRCIRANKCISLKKVAPALVNCDITDKYQQAIIKQTTGSL